MRPHHDTLGRLFARLNGELEDTCALAVEGQNPQLPPGQRTILAVRSRKRLGRTGRTVERIDVAIAHLREVDK